MSYPITRTPERWWRRAVRVNKYKRRRTRVCACGERRHTVEVHLLRKPVPQSMPDRCPRCIIGLGKILSVSYADRLSSGYQPGPNRPPGAVYRKRRCEDCQKNYGTFEVDEKDNDCKDITRCHCGQRMKVRS
jgi:hypothetical protein